MPPDSFFFRRVNESARVILPTPCPFGLDFGLVVSGGGALALFFLRVNESERTIAPACVPDACGAFEGRERMAVWHASPSRPLHRT